MQTGELTQLRAYTVRPKGRVVYQSDIEVENHASIYLIHANGEEELVFVGFQRKAELVEHEARLAQKAADNTKSPIVFLISGAKN
ncbi:MAG: hypothetical protein ABL868_03230 [Sulfuriferula sp.]